MPLNASRTAERSLAELKKALDLERESEWNELENQIQKMLNCVKEQHKEYKANMHIKNVLLRRRKCQE
jgi:hypothetical protein